jgi:hypothetical protein
MKALANLLHTHAGDAIHTRRILQPLLKGGLIFGALSDTLAHQLATTNAAEK